MRFYSSIAMLLLFVVVCSAASGFGLGDVVLSGILGNQDAIAGLYVDVDYVITTKQCGRVQRKYFSSLSHFSKKRLEGMSDADRINRKFIRLKTFGTKFDYKFTEIEGTSTVSRAWVVYDGERTREVGGDLGLSDGDAFKDAKLDITKNGIGPRISHSETPLGFLYESIGLRDGIVLKEFLAALLSNANKNDVSWDKTGRGVVCLSFGEADGKVKREMVFNPAGAFLPERSTNDNSIHRTRGESVFSYKKHMVSQREFYFPENITIQTYLVNKESAKELMFEESLKVTRAVFEELPGNGAFSLDFIPRHKVDGR